MDTTQKSNLFQNQHGQPIMMGKELGKGGEARVMLVEGHPDLVAKLYHLPTLEREAKVAAMVANPPVQPPTHTAIAWPTEMLYTKKIFSGFLMPKVTGSDPIFNFYHPVKRKQLHPDFSWLALHRTARNLAIAVHAIHAKNYVIGDVNESNFLVNSQALVTLVDTDSFQVTDLNGQVHRCNVGKPEYTPPELQGISFKTIDQQIEHDLFRLGVLIFQLLMEGYHPFTGVLPSQLSVGRVDLYCIKAGLFPYSPNASVTPPPNAPPFNILFPELQTAFRDCFVAGHHTPAKRPTAKEWAQILHEAEKDLVTCSRQADHFYNSHVKDCPWCALAKLRQKAVVPMIIRPIQAVFPQQATPRQIIQRLQFNPPPSASQPKLATFPADPLEQNLTYLSIGGSWLAINFIALLGFNLVTIIVTAQWVLVFLVVSIFSYATIIFVIGYGILLYWFITTGQQQGTKAFEIFTNLIVCFGASIATAGVWYLSQDARLGAMLTCGVYGLAMSLAQCQVIGAWLPDSLLWVAASTGAWLILGGLVALGLFGNHWLVACGVAGLIIGLCQWPILRYNYQRSGWWILANFEGWVINALLNWNLATTLNLGAEFLSFQAINDVISRGAMYSLLTSIILVWILQKPKP